VVESQEVEALYSIPEVHDRGLIGMQAQPERPQGGFGQVTGLFGTLPGGADDDEVADQRSEPPSTVGPCLIEDMEGDVGEQWGMGEACGVPASVSETTPLSNTAARNQHRSSFNIFRSTTRRSTCAIKASWSMLSKHALMSASSTHPRPPLAARRTATRSSRKIRTDSVPRQ